MWSSCCGSALYFCLRCAYLIIYQDKQSFSVIVFVIVLSCHVIRSNILVCEVFIVVKPKTIVTLLAMQVSFNVFVRMATYFFGTNSFEQGRTQRLNSYDASICNMIGISTSTYLLSSQFHCFFSFFSLTFRYGKTFSIFTSVYPFFSLFDQKKKFDEEIKLYQKKLKKQFGNELLLGISFFFVFSKVLTSKGEKKESFRSIITILTLFELEQRKKNPGIFSKSTHTHKQNSNKINKIHIICHIMVSILNYSTIRCTFFSECLCILSILSGFEFAFILSISSTTENSLARACVYVYLYQYCLYGVILFSHMLVKYQFLNVLVV